jgi:hypothetical protein
MDMKSVGQVIMIVGMLLTVIGGLGFLAHETSVSQRHPDCLTWCQVDGWQYRPLVYGGECWCDAHEGRPVGGSERGP